MATSSKITKPSSGSLAVFFLRLAFASFARAIISPFKSKGAPTYFRDVMYAMIRKQLAIQTISQARYLNKSTTDTYVDWTKSKKMEPITEELANGAKAHWVGDKSASRVIVFYHGGGYTQPLPAPYFDYLRDLAQVLSTPETSVSVVVLSYSLAPEASYPTQLIQAATLLQLLLADGKRQPSSLTLMGDSAGGNITLSVFSHILHPHPNEAVPRIQLSEPLKAIVLLSPWISFATDMESYKRNAESDMLFAPTLKVWSDMFLGEKSSHDSYSEPLRAQRGWWKDASKAVDSVLIWAGADEILVDSIEAFADKFEAGWGSGGGDGKDVTVVVTPKEAHVQPVVDVMLQSKTKSEAAVNIENWLKDRI